MIPIVRPSTSPCGEPPPNCGLARHEPVRNIEQAIGQDEHRHDHVFGDCRLVAEHVANRHALRYRVEIEQVEAGSYRSQEA
jgi:hypothetical protein